MIPFKIFTTAIPTQIQTVRVKHSVSPPPTPSHVPQVHRLRAFKTVAKQAAKLLIPAPGVRHRVEDTAETAFVITEKLPAVVREIALLLPPPPQPLYLRVSVHILRVAPPPSTLPAQEAVVV